MVKEKSVRKRNDSKWSCEQAFTVDITKCLSVLNIKLKHHNSLLSSLLLNVKSFLAKLKLSKVKLERNSSTVYSLTLQGQRSSMILAYVGEYAKFIDALSERIRDVKPTDIPDNLGHKIIHPESREK